jgi:hypothetical protein
MATHRGRSTISITAYLDVGLAVILVFIGAKFSLHRGRRDRRGRPADSDRRRHDGGDRRVADA